MKKKLLLITLTSVVVFMVLITISYFLPGKVFLIDDMRVYIQSKFLYNISPILVGKFNYDEEGNRIPHDNVILLEELNNYYENLETSDIFLTESSQFIISYFIPGKWKHSAIYLGTKKDLYKLFGKDNKSLNKILKYYKTGEEHLILDAHKNGVQIRDISELSNLNNISQLKSMVFFRLKVSNEEKINFLNKTLEYLGTPYDYDLIHGDDKRLYCSELLYYGLKEIDIKVDVFSESAFRKMISPNDLAIFLNNADISNSILYIEARDKKIQELALEDLD